jgi:hypothetical protein
MVATGRFLAGLALLWWCAQSAQAFPRLTLEREPNNTLDTASLTKHAVKQEQRR